MGNNPNLHKPNNNEKQQQEMLKLLHRKAKKNIQTISKNDIFNQYELSLLHRLMVQPKQSHIVQMFYQLQGNIEQQKKLLEDVDALNIQLLDSFYQHLIRMADERVQGCWKKQKNNEKYREYQGIFGCLSSNLHIEDSHYRNTGYDEWKVPITSKDQSEYYNIDDLTQHRDEQQEQKYKNIGLKAIVNQSVAFIMLAGGKNIRFKSPQPNQKYKQLAKITHLPSQSTLFQIMLKRLEALARLTDSKINLYIMIAQPEKKDIMRNIYNQLKQKGQCSDLLAVNYIQQISYGMLDLNSKILLTQKGQNGYSFKKHPNGHGDLWGFIENQGQIGEQLLNYQYLQIFGVSNLMEHIFDCYTLGKIIVQNRPWVTMVCQNKQQVTKNKHNGWIKNTSTYDDNVYVYFDKKQSCLMLSEPDQYSLSLNTHQQHLNKDNKIIRLHPNSHIFVNNSLICTNFIKRNILNEENIDKWLQKRQYYCKVINQCSNTVLGFEKKYTDIFKIRQSVVGSVVIVSSQDYYSQFYRYEDMRKGAEAISKLHCKWLNIKQTIIMSNEYEQKTVRKNPRLKKEFSFNDKQFGNENYIQPHNEDKKYVRYHNLSPNRLQSRTDHQKSIMCEIDPLISLEGQNLEQVILQLSINPMGHNFPIYIRPQAQISPQPSQLGNKNFQRQYNKDGQQFSDKYAKIEKKEQKYEQNTENVIGIQDKLIKAIH